MKHTPGPWRWEVNKEGKNVKLVGGIRRWDSYVMDFVRWGTQSAKPRFNTDGLMFDADKHTVPFEGRIHHFGWCAGIDHADAKLIAAAPELLEALEKISNWLVCSAIATPEDMAQSFEEMHSICQSAIKKATT